VWVQELNVDIEIISPLRDTYRYNCYLAGNIKCWLLSLHIKKTKKQEKMEK
jgi:hypothetical protein